MVFDIYEGRHEGQRKIFFNKGEMVRCYRMAEEILDLRQAPFNFSLNEIDYGKQGKNDEMDPVGFYDAVQKSFHLPTKVWNSLTLHEAIHARMDREGLLLSLNEPSEKLTTYARVIDEIVAELGVHSVMPLNLSWFLRNHNANFYDTIVCQLDSGQVCAEDVELIEREQGEPIEAMAKRFKIYSEAIRLAEFHRALEIEHVKKNDPERLRAGFQEIEARILSWHDSGYGVAGEEHFLRTFALRNTLELSASGEAPQVFSARIRNAVGKNMGAQEIYFSKVVPHKKKELEIRRV